MNRSQRRKQGKSKRRRKGTAAESVADDLLGLIRAGQQHHVAGRLVDAEKAYRSVLARDPENADANQLLGVIAMQVGNLEIAAELIGKALRRDPDHAQAHGNLGIIHWEGGRPAEAERSYRRALELNPNNSQAHSNLGLVHWTNGRLEEAEKCYRRALDIDPGNVQAHNNLGLLLTGARRLAEAEQSLRRALELNPGFAMAHDNLGLLLLQTDRGDEAFSSFRTAIALDPGNGQYWFNWAQCLQAVPIESVDPDLSRDLSRLLDQPTVDPRFVVQPIVKALSLDPAFSKIFLDATSKDPGPDAALLDAAERLSEIPLLLRIMALSPIGNPSVETMLTVLRGAAIGAAAAGERETGGLPFIAALAVHCFTNEYVFAETAEETAAVASVERQIVGLLETGLDVPPAWVAALGAYRPLGRMPRADALLEREWPDAVKAVIARQVAEPLQEQALRSEIPRLSAVTDSVSRAVREQYEENPYPRWVKTAAYDKAQTVDAVVRDLGLPLDLGDRRFPENPDILIAGCGTGQQVVATASRFANAAILGVDLSLASLAYAVRKTRELGLTNIEYGHADILELDGLGRKFDVIESIGVLHHLRDPLAGWRTLAGILKPQGLMKIGLYSETARRGLEGARALIAAQGYAPIADDIRRCRQDILRRAREDGADSTLTGVLAFTDFFAMSECRDLLFNVQEHHFTLPRIEAALNELGLTFLGFELSGRDTLERFMRSHPESQASGSLPLWHQFEADNPDTFADMYQFWVQKA